MFKLIRTLMIVTSMFWSGLIAYPQSKPPAMYVDKGACPFECCTYRRWKTKKTTIAYATPYKGSKEVGKFMAGQSVMGLTGEVRTAPGKFVVVKTHKRYKVGDVLWVYTPIGEGFYKVWFRGRMIQEELDDIGETEGQGNRNCEKDAACWGKLEKNFQSEWWVKIKGAGGLIGWTDQVDNFDNKDACG